MSAKLYYFVFYWSKYKIIMFYMLICLQAMKYIQDLKADRGGKTKVEVLDESSTDEDVRLSNSAILLFSFSLWQTVPDRFINRLSQLCPSLIENYHKYIIYITILYKCLFPPI